MHAGISCSILCRDTEYLYIIRSHEFEFYFRLLFMLSDTLENCLITIPVSTKETCEQANLDITIY